MASLIGRQLGPYTITSLLGAGGMGEVYRAHDTKLGRDVAIKFLTTSFTSDPDRLARFEHEARLLATLNHPNIGAIYGVEEGEAGGPRGLVLELVDGTTLADRIASGALQPNEALAIARQIAGALEAAHDKHIVHRDLKPANIKITPAGIVKVLDFGLAKASAADAHHSDASLSPTMTAGHTREGTILGTAAYMSPEQARGRPVDKRTDIWAFGCVLYEMLTGRRPFGGATMSDAIAQILEREPDWHAVPAAVPEPIRKLLKRCLHKDPADRLHDIADARLEIADVLAAPAGGAGKAAGVTGKERWWWAGLVITLTAIAVALWLSPGRRAGQPTATHALEFGIRFPESQLPALGLAVSPDGRRIAAGVFGAAAQIWLHSLDTDETRPVPGTENGFWPFWSPDGSSLAFFASGTIRRVNPTGGPPTQLCDAPGDPGGGTWSTDGVILFASDGKLFRVQASGGTPSPLAIEPSGDIVGHMRPQFLPDNRHFIFYEQRSGGGRVRVAALGSDRATDLVDSDYPAASAAPSHLLFVRGTSLMAQPLDLKSLTLVGDAVVVAPDVAPGFLSLSPLAASVSAADAVLAFVTPRGGDAGQLTWFDNTGKTLGSIQQPPGVEYLNPAISPSGDQVAVNAMTPQSGNWDVWILDLARGIPTRLTTDPAQDADPIWSPDGKTIAFVSNRGGSVGLYRRAVDGSGAEELLVKFDGHPTFVVPTDWSRDGRFILYSLTPRGSRQSVWALPLFGDRKPVRVLDGEFSPYAAHLSPDGRWLAYSDLETGVMDVHVRSFMVAGPKRQISHGGGVHARWTADGRQLVYWALPGGVVSVDFESEVSGFRVGMPRTLVAAPVLSLIDGRPHYDVTRDGRRFLVRQPAGPRGPGISVILNWMAKLKQ